MTCIVQLNKISDVESKLEKGYKPILLVETLRPLWKMAQFTGILLDWGGNPIGSSSSSSLVNMIKKICSFLVTCSAFSSLSGFAVFVVCKIVGGVIERLQEPKTADMVIFLTMNSMFLIPLVNNGLNMLIFTRIRKKIASLVEDFHSFESQQPLMIGKFDMVKTCRKSIFVIILITNLTLFLGWCYVLFLRQKMLIFFTGDETLTNIFPIQVLLAFEVMAVWFVVLYQILVDLIPPFIYYHAGAALKTLRDEINSKKELLFAGVRSIKISSTGGDGHRILLGNWSKYNRIRNLVGRTDELFGWMLLIDFGIKFFMICLLSYDLLNNLKGNGHGNPVTCLFVIVTYVIRLVNSIYLMSEVQRSRKLLTTQMSIHHNTYWLEMDAELRQVFTAFKFEVSSDQLAASPMDLFIVNPSLLLTMLSLIVTYLLILIQLN